MMSVTRATACVTSAIVLPASLGEHRAVLHLLDRARDQFLDLLRRRRRTLREAAHFARHHREAAALLARARRFDGRVQREDVGLERDAFDDARDVRDLRRAFADAVHRIDHAARPPRCPSARHPTRSMPACCACCALSVFCLTVEVSSSMLAAVSSSDAACCSVRWLRSVLPVAISLAALPIAPLLSRTRPTVSVRRSFISARRAAGRPFRPSYRRRSGCADRRVPPCVRYRRQR